MRRDAPLFAFLAAVPCAASACAAYLHRHGNSRILRVLSHCSGFSIPPPARPDSSRSTLPLRASMTARLQTLAAQLIMLIPAPPRQHSNPVQSPPAIQHITLRLAPPRQHNSPMPSPRNPTHRIPPATPQQHDIPVPSRPHFRSIAFPITCHPAAVALLLLTRLVQTLRHISCALPDARCALRRCRTCSAQESPANAQISPFINAAAHAILVASSLAQA